MNKYGGRSRRKTTLRLPKKMQKFKKSIAFYPNICYTMNTVRDAGVAQW
jgi:hypothetical protein